MKCERCNKEVPVLTPSPDGDRDLCGDCYGAEYRRLSASRRFPRAPILGAAVAALAVIAVVFCVMVRPGQDAPEDSGAVPHDSTQWSTPNVAHAPAPPTRPPRTDVRRPVASGTDTPGDIPSGDGSRVATDPETSVPPARPAGTAIRTAQFTLTAAPARRMAEAQIVISGEEEAEPVVLALEDEDLYELSVTIVPEDVPEVMIEGLVLFLGQVGFVPIQAKAFSAPYAAPSRDFLFLTDTARLLFGFTAEADDLRLPHTAAGIEDFVVLRTARPAQIAVTLLFALPKTFGTGGVLVLGDQEIAVPLGQ